MNEQIRVNKQSIFEHEQKMYELDKGLDKKLRDVQDLEHQIMLIDDQLTRKNQDINNLQTQKNEIENENNRKQREYNKSKQQKHLQEEFIRRTENVNMGIKQEIAVKRGQIEHWLGVCQDSKIYSKNRRIENETLF